MNVVRTENALISTRGRGGVRGRGRNATIVSNTPIVNLPKYDFKNIRQPLVNIAPSTTSSVVTPKNSRRYQTTSSSSFPGSALRRRGQTSGGQISPYSVTSDPDSCVILAITSGRGDARSEVGMAAIDVQHPHMILCQISDSNTYINTLTKIYALNPVEIIMPETMCESNTYGNGLYRTIKEKFDSTDVTAIARMHFHDSSGMERIRTHCAEEFSSVEIFVKQKYYALAAASALFKYVEYIQHIVFAPKSMRIDFQGSQNTTMIDIESAQSLELVSSQGGSGKFSLLGSLDRCSTPMGHRLIRASILQPPCDSELIKSRQACVTEFVTNRSFHSIVKPVVKRLYGASRLLNLAMLTSQADSIQSAEKNLNYVLLLKNIIDTIPELRSIVSNGQAPFFQKVSEDLKDPRYELIKEKILSVVHPEARSVTGYTSSNMQRCFAIRSGINDMLDIARQTYCELIDDMQSLVEKLADRYNLRLSLGCNANLGYHIEMDASRSQRNAMKELPQELIEVHKKRNTLYMTTEYLLVLSQHCRDACEELHIMSNVLLNETMNEVREYIGCLLKLSDNVGELDLLMSMAQISSISEYVLPSFGKRLELRESRHPVMDISGSDSPIPNDVIASTSHNFHTITGPNMSGKSVYLKQIVLLQIMAQMGCYVPAKSAEFRIADRIFCKMCRREDIESDASTFVMEIKESQYILQCLTANSLVVLDELCRGTTVEEGTSLAWSICEKLLYATAFTFNATHFFYLTRLAELYHNASNSYIETETSTSRAGSRDGRLIYTHRLRPGIAPIWNYGIALARSTGLPETIVSNAKAYAEVIASSVKPSENEDQEKSWKKSFYDCIAEMSRLAEYDQFTVSNVVALVNEYNIPTIVKQLRGNRANQTARPGDETNSEIFASNANDRVSIGDEEREASKRESATNLSSRVHSKRSRIFPSVKKRITTPTQFNYLRRTTSRSNFSFSSSPVSANESIREKNSSLDECRFSMDIDEQATGNAANSVAVTTRERDSKGSVLSPDFSCRSLTSEQRYDASSTGSELTAASSIPRYIAGKMVGEETADIFRNIEGSDFDEASFFRSLQETEDMICS